MESTTHTERRFAVATLETLIGNLKAAIDFNASLELVSELTLEINRRTGDILTSFFSDVK